MDPSSSFISTLSAKARGLVDQVNDTVHHAVNPNHLQIKVNLEKGSKALQLTAVITGIVAGIFAVSAIASGSFLMVIPVALFGAVAFNSFHLSENLSKIAKIPGAYINALTQHINVEKLKNDLGKGTFGCQTLIGLAAEKYNKEMDNAKIHHRG